MAKSLRCKVKKNARSKKRESGEYHIKDAERVARLNARLLENNSKKEVIGTDEVELKEGSGEGESAEEEAGEGGEDAAMTGDAAPAQKISTSGPRGNRRENWRESKGMKPKPTTHGMTAKGKIRGARKAGRPGRRR